MTDGGSRAGTGVGGGGGQLTGGPGSGLPGDPSAALTTLTQQYGPDTEEVDTAYNLLSRAASAEMSAAASATVLATDRLMMGMGGVTNGNWSVLIGNYTDHSNVTYAWDNNNTVTVPMESLVSLNYNLPTMIIVAAVLFVVIVATAFGNLLVCVALFRYRYLRTVSNYLIGNLAVSDFLLATTILPLSTVNECLGHWVFGQVMCNLWLCTDVLYCTASIWNLCVIAFDRFTATLYPLWYREKRSTMQAAIYVTITWVVSGAICVPPVLGWNDLSQNYVYDNKTNVYHCMLFQTPSYVAYSAAGSFYIPFFITFFLYVRIFMVLRLRMRKMRNASKMHQQRLQQSTANSKPLLNNAKAIEASKTDNQIEMTNTVTCTNDGSGNTEEMSSKSLFGSDSGAEGESGEEEESSTQNKSDNPLYQSSCSEADAAPRSGLLKNGVHRKTDKVGSNVVISNPHHQLSESEQSDTDKIKIVVTDDDKSKNSSTRQSLLPHVGNKAIVIKTASTVSNTSGSKNALSNALSNIKTAANPFKQQKKKIRSSQKRKYEQREMRATIRMAIIIGVFCGMWLGFFTIYFINGFCGSACYIPRELDAFFFWLGYSNSSVNPILYTIFNEEFRRAFQKILGCYRKNKRGAVRR